MMDEHWAVTTNGVEAGSMIEIGNVVEGDDFVGNLMSIYVRDENGVESVVLLDASGAGKLHAIINQWVWQTAFPNSHIFEGDNNEQY